MKKQLKNQAKSGAALLVDCMEAHGVKYIFGVPGASLIPILDVLHDRGPEFIVCRHEQNAAFMAQAWGRLTGHPGVCMATMGPGATNLVTGVATATADRDPVVAITGQTPRAHRFKSRHQNIEAAALFAPITKWSVEIEDTSAIPEAMAQAFRTAAEPRLGATHLAFPTDILTETATTKPLVRLPNIMKNEEIYDEKLAHAAAFIRGAKRPVMFIGVGAADERSTAAIRHFLKKTGMPAVCTFEAAGVVGRELVGQFLGRVGLSTEEPGDIALREADVVMAVGYDVVEYAPALWITKAKIIHIDRLPANVDADYITTTELIGDIAAIVKRLTSLLANSQWHLTTHEAAAQKILLGEQTRGLTYSGTPIHPARLIAELRRALNDTDIVISDVGSHQVWLAREYFTYEPKTLLFSMGFQAMGVALPWAIAARLAEPSRRIVSCSGDGSFLMSAMELETAVRRKLNLVHVVWRDGSYNLVEIQQQMAHGRIFGTKFGNPDIVKFAKSFGATGLRAKKPEDIAQTFAQAFQTKGPVVIDVPVDYRHNVSLLGKGSLFE